MAKFHYADFPVTSTGKFRGSRRNGIWAKGDVMGLSWTCRGRHWEVGIVEFGLYLTVSISHSGTLSSVPNLEHRFELCMERHSDYSSPFSLRQLRVYSQRKNTMSWGRPERLTSINPILRTYCSREHHSNITNK